MAGHEARDDEREALDYVTALNEHVEDQFSRGVESAHGYDEESFIAGVRWALARKHSEPEITDEMVSAAREVLDDPHDEWPEEGYWNRLTRAALEAAFRVPVGEGEQ